MDKHRYEMEQNQRAAEETLANAIGRLEGYDWHIENTRLGRVG